MSKYKTFWDWFISVENHIYNNLEKDTDNIAFDITEHLSKIHPDLAFEIPFDMEDNERILIISADGNIELFDTVITLVENAPIIDNWRIQPFRPRLHQRNQIIDLAGISLDYNDIYFKYKIIDRQLDLDVYINGYDGKDNRYVHLYFLVLDSLIGEYDAVTIIKETRVHPLNKKQDLLDFPRLIEIIEELK